MIIASLVPEEKPSLLRHTLMDKKLQTNLNHQFQSEPIEITSYKLWHSSLLIHKRWSLFDQSCMLAFIIGEILTFVKSGFKCFLLRLPFLLCTFKGKLELKPKKNDGSFPHPYTSTFWEYVQYSFYIGVQTSIYYKYPIRSKLRYQRWWKPFFWWQETQNRHAIQNLLQAFC